MSKKSNHILVPLSKNEIGDFWFWCIRCGVLKIGDSYFAHGPKQKKVMHCCLKDPKCKKKLSKNPKAIDYDMPDGAWG